MAVSWRRSIDVNVLLQGLMGVFLKVKSPAFIEDLPIDESKLNEDHVYSKYDQASTNCFIASGMYVAVFGLSAICWHINSRRNYTMS